MAVYVDQPAKWMPLDHAMHAYLDDDHFYFGMLKSASVVAFRAAELAALSFWLPSIVCLSMVLQTSCCMHHDQAAGLQYV